MSIVEQLIKKQKGSSSRQHSSKKNNTNNSILEEESDHKKYNLTKGNVLNRYSYRYENIPTKRNKIPERKRVPAASALQGRNPQWHEVTHAGKNIYGSDQEINVNHIIDPLRSIARRPSHSLPNPRDITIISGTHGTDTGQNWNRSGKWFSRWFGKRFKYLLEPDFFTEDQRDYQTLGNRNITVLDSGNMTRSDYEREFDDDNHVILGFCFSRNDRSLLTHTGSAPVTSYLEPASYNSAINDKRLKNNKLRWNG
ncbi:hypothetical protein [Xenorhabdus szentirmaii]|uniref:hypothetical protein n=1 Tax=Xenorhabdus szentirmaii TaxID=290112 RepID=UPI000C050FBD|nr:hypothetical protein [Xenorhabdus szentirmaii]PHM44265.1 hypothetical protein Xszus_04095 [Xenorhabdus szentirmaii]